MNKRRVWREVYRVARLQRQVPSGSRGGTAPQGFGCSSAVVDHPLDSGELRYYVTWFIEAVFKPARNDGGVATVSMHVGGYGEAQLASDAFGVSQGPRRRCAAQQLSNDSTQVSFQISKKISSDFQFLWQFLTQKMDSFFCRLTHIHSNHCGARDPVDFSVPVAYHSIVVVVVVVV